MRNDQSTKEGALREAEELVEHAYQKFREAYILFEDAQENRRIGLGIATKFFELDTRFGELMDSLNKAAGRARWSRSAIETH